AARFINLNVFSLRFPPEHRSVVPSRVPLCASAPPVKGVLRLYAHLRKRFFEKTRFFVQRFKKINNNNALMNHKAVNFMLRKPLKSCLSGETAF
ncbi:hypothetical protein, partial [Thalassovita sp.]|uniref:hypothetical protein n=1 Tax=Thalassovita sp. TaxID=1979401 RepID=UPI002B27299B